jgi:hypothetical protein
MRTLWRNGDRAGGGPDIAVASKGVAAFRDKISGERFLANLL